MNLRAQLIASGALKAGPKPMVGVANNKAILARRHEAHVMTRTDKAMSILHEAARRTSSLDAIISCHNDYLSSDKEKA